MEANRSRYGSLTVRIKSRSTKKLVCDTDFLIKVTSEPLPAVAEFLSNQDYSLVTIQAVVRELRGLSKGKTISTCRKAANALRTVGDFVRVIDRDKKNEKELEADLELFDFARSGDHRLIVATFDGNLLSKFERSDLPYFTLRHNRPFLRAIS